MKTLNASDHVLIKQPHISELTFLNGRIKIRFNGNNQIKLIFSVAVTFLTLTLLTTNFVRLGHTNTTFIVLLLEICGAFKAINL